jgi:hypothetical protein
VPPSVIIEASISSASTAFVIIKSVDFISQPSRGGSPNGMHTVRPNPSIERTSTGRSCQTLGSKNSRHLAEFRRWFAEFDLTVWDRQIEADALAGKLDNLLAEAEEDYKTGQPREL